MSKPPYRALWVVLGFLSSVLAIGGTVMTGPWEPIGGDLDWESWPETEKSSYNIPHLILDALLRHRFTRPERAPQPLPSHPGKEN